MARFEYGRPNGNYYIKIYAALPQDRSMLGKLNDAFINNEVTPIYNPYDNNGRYLNAGELTIHPVTKENYSKVLKAYEIVEKEGASENFEPLPKTFEEFVSKFPTVPAPKPKKSTLESAVGIFRQALKNLVGPKNNLTFRTKINDFYNYPFLKRSQKNLRSAQVL